MTKGAYVLATVRAWIDSTEPPEEVGNSIWQVTEGHCLLRPLPRELVFHCPPVSISVATCTASRAKSTCLISLCQQMPYFPKATPAPRPHTTSQDPFRSNQNGLTCWFSKEAISGSSGKLPAWRAAKHSPAEPLEGSRRPLTVKVPGPQPWGVCCWSHQNLPPALERVSLHIFIDFLKRAIPVYRRHKSLFLICSRTINF